MSHERRIVLLGDSGVGKSTFINTIIKPDGCFDPNIPSTIGMDFYSYVYRNIAFNFLEISGSQQFDTLRKTYVLNADIAIFFYDLTNDASLKNLTEYAELVHSINNTPYSHMIMVGTKLDLKEKRKIGLNEISKKREEIAEIFGIPSPNVLSYETSSCSGQECSKRIRNELMMQLYHIFFYKEVYKPSGDFEMVLGKKSDCRTRWSVLKNVAIPIIIASITGVIDALVSTTNFPDHLGSISLENFTPIQRGLMLSSSVGSILGIAFLFFILYKKNSRTKDNTANEQTLPHECKRCAQQTLSP
jgi:small GTP-binding protein